MHLYSDFAKVKKINSELINERKSEFIFLLGNFNFASRLGHALQTHSIAALYQRCNVCNELSGRSGGAMVLGKLPVPGRSTIG